MFDDLYIFVNDEGTRYNIQRVPVQTLYMAEVWVKTQMAKPDVPEFQVEIPSPVGESTWLSVRMNEEMASSEQLSTPQQRMIWADYQSRLAEYNELLKARHGIISLTSGLVDNPPIEYVESVKASGVDEDDETIKFLWIVDVVAPTQNEKERLKEALAKLQVGLEPEQVSAIAETFRTEVQISSGGGENSNGQAAGVLPRTLQNSMVG